MWRTDGRTDLNYRKASLLKTQRYSPLFYIKKSNLLHLSIYHTIFISSLYLSTFLTLFLHYLHRQTQTMFILHFHIMFVYFIKWFVEVKLPIILQNQFASKQGERKRGVCCTSSESYVVTFYYSFSKNLPLCWVLIG